MAQDILDQIFKSFDVSTKTDWEQQAAKDLKGKAVRELNWQITKGLTMEAYANSEDLKDIDHSALKNRNADWQVGQHYLISNYQQSNQELLADLMHGLNAPVITFTQNPSLSDLEQLFEGIGLSFIATHINAPSKETITSIQDYLEKKGIEAADFYFRAEQVIAKASKSLLIDARSSKGDTLSEIKQSLEKAKTALLASQDPQACAEQMSFVFNVDNNYLVSIAKLRAFNLLWLALLKNLKLSGQLPFVYVEMLPEAFGEDEHDNLINASSMAMSAVLGGADHLIVKPSSDTASAKRLARNIQLILKHESGFNQVADPVQGSYYIESLTKKIVNLCQ